MRARELGRRGVVVGDRVALVGDVSGGPDTLARMVRVEPRTIGAAPLADDTDPVERVIVANADQLVIVTALADPPPRPRLIDRAWSPPTTPGWSRCSASPRPTWPAPDELLAAYGAARASPHVVTRAAADQPGSAPLREYAAPAGSACWSATPASASPRWSTR